MQEQPDRAVITLLRHNPYPVYN